MTLRAGSLRRCTLWANLRLLVLRASSPSRKTLRAGGQPFGSRPVKMGLNPAPRAQSPPPPPPHRKRPPIRLDEPIQHLQKRHVDSRLPTAFDSQIAQSASPSEPPDGSLSRPSQDLDSPCGLPAVVLTRSFPLVSPFGLPCGSLPCSRPAAWVRAATSPSRKTLRAGGTPLGSPPHYAR